MPTRYNTDMTSRISIADPTKRTASKRNVTNAFQQRFNAAENKWFFQKLRFQECRHYLQTSHIRLGLLWVSIGRVSSLSRPQLGGGRAHILSCHFFSSVQNKRPTVEYSSAESPLYYPLYSGLLKTSASVGGLRGRRVCTPILRPLDPDPFCPPTSSHELDPSPIPSSEEAQPHYAHPPYPPAGV